MQEKRETMTFDVIIVGGGPAGLAAAIRLAQLSQKHSISLQIAVLEKGAEIGAHSLSGAVLEPSALNELIPDWQQRNAPIHTTVTRDVFLYLTKKNAFRLPTPPQMRNQGNYILSLGQFCRFLAEYAESLGVSIFPGFAATKCIMENNRVMGVTTGDKGVDRFSQPTARFQPGIDLLATYTFFAEGCRGSLSEQVIAHFDLRKHCAPQTYGLGIKELWEIPEELHQAGLVMHSVGWPLQQNTFGGSFMYHFDNNLLAIGFVVGLDYTNPYLNPYEEFQKLKCHPAIYPLLKNGKRIGYGARTLNEGGWQSIPQLTFPGGLLVGCAAGFLNTPKIKGIHNAMKSGMLAAESVFLQIQENKTDECKTYTEKLKQSHVYKELYHVRNIRPAFHFGLWPGLILSAIDTYLLRGHAPWTLQYTPDHQHLKLAKTCRPMAYPKHDQQVTFDMATSLYLANIQYQENQPYHLKLTDRSIAIQVNYTQYASPETRYCPAGVYEIVVKENQPRLHINGSNCIHCKACDIKDPTQNITWTPSEGGSGPMYGEM